MTNPIFAFSARRRMRSPRTALLLTLYGLAVLIFGVVTAFSALLQPAVTIDTMSKGMEGYIFMLIFQFVLLLLVTPALTSGSISGERERQTLELLLVTNTGSLRIVLGKLMESLAIVLLMIVATLPAMCLPLIVGGITFVQILEGLLFLAVEAFACLSVGILASALFRRTVAATVVAYLTVFAIGIFTLFPLAYDIAFGQTVVNTIYSSSTAAMSSSVAVIGGADGPISLIVGEGKLILWGFVFNPALGLAALICEQTGLIQSLFQALGLSDIADMVDFNQLKWLSMLFMFTAGLALDLIAACFVRPRKTRVRRGKKK